MSNSNEIVRDSLSPELSQLESIMHQWYFIRSDFRMKFPDAYIVVPSRYASDDECPVPQAVSPWPPPHGLDQKLIKNEYTQKIPKMNQKNICLEINNEKSQNLIN